MAELKSIFEQIDPDEEAAAIAEAEAELHAGKGVPHEKVREWLLKLAKSSCADLIRVSTPFFPILEGVDGRAKPGQDEVIRPISRLFDRKISPDSPAASGGGWGWSRCGRRLCSRSPCCAT